MAKYQTSYKIQQKFCGFLWITIGLSLSLEDAEYIIRDRIRSREIAKANPRDIIVKEY
jgi:hypothetical protein